MATVSAVMETQKTIEATLFARMDDFEAQLKSASPASDGKDGILQLQSDFNAFRELVWNILSLLRQQIAQLLGTVDDMVMRHRRKFLLISGIPESEDEDLSTVVATLMKKHLGITEISTSSIKACFRLGSVTNRRVRPVVVRFVDADVRNDVWKGKTKLKGTSLVISEYLTRSRQGLFQASREHFGVRRVWTAGGNIYIKTPDGSRQQVRTPADLQLLADRHPKPTSEPKLSDEHPQLSAEPDADMKGTTNMSPKAAPVRSRRAVQQTNKPVMSDTDDFYSLHDSSSSFHSFNSSLDFSLKQELSHELIDFAKCFKACHINAQSIPCHITDFLDTFSSDTVHAVLVSETWLKPCLNSALYCPPGFELFRNDRVGKGGGGVAIYLSSRIPAKILYSSFSHHGCMEHLFLEIDIRGTKVILGVVYCPPSIDYFSDLEVLIDSCAIDYNHHIIMGDFNTDLLINSPSSRKLRSLITSANFSFLQLNPSHHNLNTSDTWIDHIIVSSSDRVVKFGQISAPCFSRHDLIYIAYDVKPPKSKPKMISIRNFARMDTEKLERDASLIDWSPIREMPSANDMVTYFNTEVLKLFDRHAPIKKVKLKRLPAPWITPGAHSPNGNAMENANAFDFILLFLTAEGFQIPDAIFF
ncbi:hypothetical protein evm_014681 [Chilo suppressalis]|nr:hypothetical protein evm_014681 [Chilo suppressalis]